MDIKRYQINEKKFFNFNHMRHLNMIQKENNRHSTIIIIDTKNEKSREKLKNIVPYIFEVKNKKSKDFGKAVKKFKNDENYEFKNIMIERHFLFKALKEINENLTKIKEGFLIDFSSKLHKCFNDQTLFYWRMKRYITEDEVFGINLVNEDFYYFDLVIKQNAKDEEFIPCVDKLKTYLLVIYIDAY